MSVQIKNQTTGNWEKAALGAKEVQDQIGDLTNLTTTAKNNLVAAINEAAQSGGSGGSTPVMQGATASTDGRAGSAPKPFIADRNKALFGDGRYHNVSTGAKSAVIAYVTNDDFIGETVTLTDGSTTLTGTIGNDGEYMFDNLTMWGPVQLSCTHSGDTIRGSAALFGYGNYFVTLTSDYSTVTITTSDTTLYGNEVLLLKENGNGDILYSGTINNNGTAVIYVDKLQKYYIQAYNASGVLCKGSITVSNYGENYTAMVGPFELYGYIVDLTDSNPETCISVPEDCDNYGFNNARMNFTTGQFDYGSWTGNEFFFPKPCMLLYDGTVDYYLDPDDYTKKADGTASDVANISYSGNAMMEFPTIYFKRETDTANNTITVRISNTKIDSDYHAYAHHDVNGNVLDYIYIGCYDMSNISSKGRSISGQHGCNTTTIGTSINIAQACNDNNEQGEGWYLWHKADWDMLRDLCLLISGTLDSQTAFGKGVCPSGSASSVINSGTMNNKGLFFGYSSNQSAVKVFGIENVWGNYGYYITGWLSNSFGGFLTKMTYGTEDGSTVSGFNLTGSGYISSNGTGVASADFVKTWQCTELGYIPITCGGSATTYTCDLYYYSLNAIVRVGGSAYNSDTQVGLFNAYAQVTQSSSDWDIGGGLTYKGAAY